MTSTIQQSEKAVEDSRCESVTRKTYATTPEIQQVLDANPDIEVFSVRDFDHPINTGEPDADGLIQIHDEEVPRDNLLDFCVDKAVRVMPKDNPSILYDAYKDFCSCCNQEIKNPIVVFEPAPHSNGITKEQIAELKEALTTNQEVLENGIVLIYKQQTEEEQESDATVEDNGFGFTGFDARSLSYMAKWILDGKHLSGKFLEKAKKLMPKYAKQILTIQEMEINSSSVEGDYKTRRAEMGYAE